MTRNLLAWGESTSSGWRFKGRIYIKDILGPREEPVPARAACKEVMAILRGHGRPMSFTLVRSRTSPTMPAFLLAACLARLITRGAHS